MTEFRDTEVGLGAGYVACDSPSSVGLLYNSRVLCHSPVLSGTKYAWDSKVTF